jgi:hypothetical protein
VHGKVVVRFFSAHGKGHHTPSHPGAVSCFFLPCAMKKRTTKIIYHALSEATHGKGVYRAKCYCVPFAVRPDEKRTAKGLPCFYGICRALVAHDKAVVSRSDHIMVKT